MKDRTDPTNRDTVPAMLTPGEFVVNKEATQMYADQLKAMNNSGLALRAKRNSMVGVPPNYNTGGLVSFLKDKEGFEGEAYPDLGWIKDEDGNRIRPKKGSKWTIGYGRIFNDDGSPVKQGDTTDRKSEDAWLDSRAKKEYDAVKKFSDDEGYGWNQNQLEAFASFRFNAGPENFKMLAHKNRGQPGFMDVPKDPGYDMRYNRSTREMIDKMPLYRNVRVGDKLVKVSGLENRRAAEVDLAGPVSYDKRYQGWEVPAVQKPIAQEPNNWMSNMLKTIGKGEAMKGAMIPGYNEGGMPMEDDDIMNFIKNYQGNLGDVNPEDVSDGIISDEELLQNSSNAGANSFMEANQMQYGDPRQSMPMPGAFMGNITDAQSLRGGVVRPDMMPPGYVSPAPKVMPRSTSPQGGADRIALNNITSNLDLQVPRSGGLMNAIVPPAYAGEDPSQMLSQYLAMRNNPEMFNRMNSSEQQRLITRIDELQSQINADNKKPFFDLSNAYNAAG